MLYLIEILHQTTTAGIAQPATFELYLIEILHQTTTKRSRTRDRSRCILSKFYIKPQRLCRCSSWPSGCILSKFYIKPQRGLRRNEGVVRCILSKFYIKPQHLSIAGGSRNVVSYRNSTSNHNSARPASAPPVLYLIEILHQTTTPFFIHCFLCRCILSKFYIKPQPIPERVAALRRCILSKFYIKPQLQIALPLRTAGCILSKFYIKPQLCVLLCGSAPCCILSKFYIKPQLSRGRHYFRRVVSYRNSTSNHNVGPHID